jgi:DNA-binding NarL/FixJ family response regulator
MIRVAVVDDQPLVRTGIAMFLDAEDDITVVAQAADGQEALAQVRAERPDVVLMDVRMPGTDGIAATRAIIDEGLTTQNGQPIRIIILTTYHVDEAVYSALHAGASGFLLKDATPTEIIAAIHAVAAGKAFLDPDVTRRLINEIATRPKQHTHTPAQISQLTPREREVLILVAQGMSNTEVAAELGLREVTVRTHLARVMAKLEVQEKSQAVAVAYQTGLVQSSPPRPSPSQ